MQTTEAVQEKVFTVDKWERTWSEGPGEWSRGITSTENLPLDSEDGAAVDDNLTHEAVVTYLAGFEGLAPGNDTDTPQTYRLVKEINYSTAGKYATREEARTAGAGLIAYLKSTGQMPEQPNWRKYEE